MTAHDSRHSQSFQSLPLCVLPTFSVSLFRFGSAKVSGPFLISKSFSRFFFAPSPLSLSIFPLNPLVKRGAKVSAFLPTSKSFARFFFSHSHLLNTSILRRPSCQTGCKRRWFAFKLQIFFIRFFGPVLSLSTSADLLVERDPKVRTLSGSPNPCPNILCYCYLSVNSLCTIRSCRHQRNGYLQRLFQELYIIVQLSGQTFFCFSQIRLPPF